MDETERHIRSLAPDFQPYVVHFVSEVRRAGVPLLVISGRRSAITNREAGGVTNSLHLYGYAFDVQVMGYPREALPVRFWAILGAFWEQMGGRWGGRFSTPDVNHFDAGYAVTL